MKAVNRRVATLTGAAVIAALTGGIAVAASPSGHGRTEGRSHARTHLAAGTHRPALAATASPTATPTPSGSTAPRQGHRGHGAPGGGPGAGGPFKGGPGQPVGPGHGRGPGGGPGGPGVGPGGPGILHGQVVRETSTGTVQTDDFQNGVVTAVSATSLTVESTDGFSLTYVLTSSTKEQGPGWSTSATPLADGDEVSVTGTVGSGGTVTATVVDNHGTKPTASPTASPTATPTATSTD